jgi:hypothetical protein
MLGIVRFEHCNVYGDSGRLFMFLAMVWYCVELDTSRTFVRALFALLMLCTFPFGQIVYYFLVYRPQTARVEIEIIQ